MTTYNGQAITYDAIGNPLNYRDGITMTWQNGRELATFTNNSDGTEVTYTYDISGMRTGKTVTQNGTATEYTYVYENGLLLKMMYNNVSLVFSYDANGLPVSVTYNLSNGSTTDYYYALNQQGDVVALYSSNGSLNSNYSYDAYGKLISVTRPSGTVIDSPTHIANLNPLRYRGYVYDRETGLYYLQSRYYDPTTCRFVNGDVMVNTKYSLNGANLFCYCYNNPIAFVDDQGFMGIPLWMKNSSTDDGFLRIIKWLFQGTVSVASDALLSVLGYSITNELFNVALKGGSISSRIQDEMKTAFIESDELAEAVTDVLRHKAKSSTIRGLHGTVVFEKDNDLYFGIHEAHFYLTGEYLSNGRWKLNVKISDNFDFSNYWIPTKGVDLASVANDLGFFMQNNGMLTSYNWSVTFLKTYFVGV